MEGDKTLETSFHTLVIEHFHRKLSLMMLPRLQPIILRKAATF
jgi:hypothetical protein